MNSTSPKQRISLTKALEGFSIDKLTLLTEKRLKLVNDSECLIWPGYRNEKGYGRVMIKSKLFMVNRVIWFIHNGEPDIEMLHSCDNPPCGNIQHLSTGTQKDNALDKLSKGRHGNKQGELNGRNILNEIEVNYIRSMKGSVSERELARIYGVSRGCITGILSGKNWR